MRLARQAFIDDVNFGSPEIGNGIADGSIPLQYDKNLTYRSKILYVRSRSEKPKLVDGITEQLLLLEPELALNRLHESVSHNVSIPARYAKVKKHPFNRK